MTYRFHPLTWCGFRMRHRARIALQLRAATSLVLLGACVEEPVEESFSVDPLCYLANLQDPVPLEATLGEWDPGTDAYQRISTDQPPLAIYGPQGGHHFLIGLEILNPNPQYPGVRVDMRASICAPHLYEDGMPLRCDDPDNWIDVASAVVETTEGADTWWPQSDGTLLLGDYFLITEWWQAQRDARIDVTVLDACGRTTELTWTGQTGA